MSKRSTMSLSYSLILPVTVLVRVMPWNSLLEGRCSAQNYTLECYEANLVPQQLWEMTATNTGDHIPLWGVSSSLYGLIPRHFSWTVLMLWDGKKTCGFHSPKKSQRFLEHQAWVRMSGHSRETSPEDREDNRPVAKASNIWDSWTKPRLNRATCRFLASNGDTWQNGGHHRGQGAERRHKNEEIAGCSHETVKKYLNHYEMVIWGFRQMQCTSNKKSVQKLLQSATRYFKKVDRMLQLGQKWS